MIIWSQILDWIENMRCPKIFYCGMKIHPERTGLIASSLCQTRIVINYVAGYVMKEIIISNVINYEI